MKEVFVLGAGASKALAKLPLGNELIWNYHIDCALCKPHVNGVADMTQDNIQFAKLREFLVLAIEIYPELAPKLKEFDNRGINIFTPIMDSKKYFVDEILKVLQETGNKEGTSLIKKLILKHLDKKSRSNRNAYKGFIEKVLMNKKAENVSIISFNFDYLLNDYYENGIDNEVYFDYLLDFDDVLKDGYRHKNPTPLIKLHGSLDWGLCNKCNKLRLYFPHMVDRYYFGQVCYVGKCDGIMEPYIFLPHQKHDKRIRLLWDTAEKVLREAKKITIVGYSFPEYDKKAIKLFENALGDNVEVELEVVDKSKSDSDIKRRYKQIFQNLKNEIKISVDGFEGYMNNYINANK